MAKEHGKADEKVLVQTRVSEKTHARMKALAKREETSVAELHRRLLRRALDLAEYTVGR